MPTTPRGLRAFNLFSLIALGIGLVLIVSTAMVQAEVLANWDAARALLTSSSAEGAETVFDPTGGLITKRYIIGGVFVICGLAAHAWMRKNRNAAAEVAAA
jgi:O-antigen ligase